MVFICYVGLLPHLSGLREATEALSHLRQQIERKPLIDIRDSSGIQLSSDQSQPSYVLENVTFAYPCKPNVAVLNGVSLTFRPGCFTALVGPSGGGKSTIAALLLRLYDLDATVMSVQENMRMLASKDMKEFEGDSSLIQGAGVVRFAGHDVKTLNVKSLRSQVAVVLQNPQLISGTILENISAGLAGTDLEWNQRLDDPNNPAALQRLTTVRQLCQKALEKAQAWDFVSALPKGLDEVVIGGRAGVLSGGQVQRIAIARALVGSPRCLLLDEATSAIATDVELKVQQMLLEEQRERGMTLIVIAHRLSTIKKADNIIMLESGSVVQEGTYEALMDPECKEQSFRRMVLAVVGDSKENEEDQNKISSSNSSGKCAVTGDISHTRLELTHEDVHGLPAQIRTISDAVMQTKWTFISGMLFCFLSGFGRLSLFFLVARGYDSLSNPDPSEMKHDVNTVALAFTLMIIPIGLVAFLASYCLGLSGDDVGRLLKRDSIRAIVSQEIAFFEGEDGRLDGLTAATNMHPANVANVFGTLWCEVTVALMGLIGAPLVGLISCWRLGLPLLPVTGFLILAGKFGFDSNSRFEAEWEAEGMRGANWACETATSSQLIASLGAESIAYRHFATLGQGRRHSYRALLLGKIGLATAQSGVGIYQAVCFYYGSILIADKHQVS